MEFDLNKKDRALVVELLRNYGPLNMTDEQEEMLHQLANRLVDCGLVGTTLHIN